MTIPDAPRVGRSSVEKSIEENLIQALKTDNPETKNYHIRTALQLYFIREPDTQAAQSQTDQP